jgi:hypothetical protein
VLTAGHFVSTAGHLVGITGAAVSHGGPRFAGSAFCANTDDENSRTHPTLSAQSNTPLRFLRMRHLLAGQRELPPCSLGQCTPYCCRCQGERKKIPANCRTHTKEHNH